MERMKVYNLGEVRDMISANVGRELHEKYIGQMLGMVLATRRLR